MTHATVWTILRGQSVKYHEDKTRSIIALTIAGLCVCFLVGAAVMGLANDGDFYALKSVVTYVQAPLGLLFGYYFTRRDTTERQ